MLPLRAVATACWVSVTREQTVPKLDTFPWKVLSGTAWLGSPHPRMVIVGSRRGARPTAALGILEGHGGYVAAVAIALDGRRAVSGSGAIALDHSNFWFLVADAPPERLG